MKIREPDTDLEDHMYNMMRAAGLMKRKVNELFVKIQLGKEVLEIAMLCILHICKRNYQRMYDEVLKVLHSEEQY